MFKLSQRKNRPERPFISVETNLGIKRIDAKFSGPICQVVSQCLCQDQQILAEWFWIVGNVDPLQ